MRQVMLRALIAATSSLGDARVSLCASALSRDVCVRVALDSVVRLGVADEEPCSTGVKVW